MNKIELNANILRQATLSLRKDRTHVPYVVECTGMPKAGKTTIIRRLRHVLEVNGLSVIVVDEAATLKVDKRFRSDLFAFNILCALENLSSLLRVVHARGQCDVAILDRGIYDSIVWTEFLADSGLLNSKMKMLIANFLLSKAWFSQIDMISIISVSRSTYVTRASLANAVPIEPRFNPDYFNRLDSAYEKATQHLDKIPESIRPLMKRWDTSVPPVEPNTVDPSSFCLSESSLLFNNIAVDMANHIASGILDKNAEHIAVIDADRVQEDIASITTPDKMDEYVFTLFGHTEASEIERVVSRETPPRVKYVLRASAEKNAGYVQLIAAAFLTRDGKYMAMKRSEAEHRPQLRGKLTILVSGHVDSKDQALAAGGRNEIENCLLREMSEELSHFDRPYVKARFVFRLGDTEMGKRHLGFVYEVHTNSDRVMVSMLPGAGNYEQEVQWLTLSQLTQQFDKLDDWSQAVVTRLS
ncbi:MAG TPA: deoxynucleoside kinase [Kiritimatiellia bacterium]|nr:deoxynucleoside kinase [Saprospiraceae bacterium]HMP00548.1 deoxynucleoside kinase [Kiritimatiellia bacterium]